MVLKSRGVHVISKKGKPDALKVFLYLLFLLLLLLWVFEVSKLAFQFSFSVLPESFTLPLFEADFLKISGVVIIAFGIVLLPLALLNFNNSLRFGMDEQNRPKLITGGVLSVSRNPFFLSIDLYFLGTVLVNPGWFFIVYAALAMVSIHFFILKEEKFLLHVYGEDYLKYKQKVMRYF